jgi:hypothetical protein
MCSKPTLYPPSASALSPAMMPDALDPTSMRSCFVGRASKESETAISTGSGPARGTRGSITRRYNLVESPLAAAAAVADVGEGQRIGTHFGGLGATASTLNTERRRLVISVGEEDLIKLRPRPPKKDPSERHAGIRNEPPCSAASPAVGVWQRGESQRGESQLAGPPFFSSHKRESRANSHGSSTAVAAPTAGSGAGACGTSDIGICILASVTSPALTLNLMS